MHSLVLVPYSSSYYIMSCFAYPVAVVARFDFAKRDCLSYNTRTDSNEDPVEENIHCMKKARWQHLTSERRHLSLQLMAMQRRQ
jgi:hypothetical protein